MDPQVISALEFAFVVALGAAGLRAIHRMDERDVYKKYFFEELVKAFPEVDQRAKARAKSRPKIKKILGLA